MRQNEATEHEEEVEQNFVATKEWQRDETVNDMQMEKNNQQGANASETVEGGKALNRLHNATSVLVDEIATLPKLAPVHGIGFPCASTVEIFHPAGSRVRKS
ncbi:MULTISPECIES: hypothetical protein [unclassified Pseudomonas]|uniref:hypothetical protein n=1 Tax=unclassified Pseudomonas TaxID=196821 RepID=UPI0021146864|nr:MULTISPECIES: hypothetical protein [unclassified Pseudomonas]